MKKGPKCGMDKAMQVRMDGETLGKLDYLVDRFSSDRSKIIRRGINMQYDEETGHKRRR